VVNALNARQARKPARWASIVWPDSESVRQEPCSPLVVDVNDQSDVQTIDFDLDAPLLEDADFKPLGAPFQPIKLRRD
jgi:hypothetical protein